MEDKIFWLICIIVSACGFFFAGKVERLIRKRLSAQPPDGDFTDVTKKSALERKMDNRILSFTEISLTRHIDPKERVSR